MSEPREECYKCLNNQSCPSIADYGSIVCMTTRKFKMPTNKEDSVYAIKLATMQKQIDEKDKRIKELEEENTQLEAIKDNAIRRYNLESIPVQKVKEILQKNRNELFSTTYLDPIQYKPFEMQVERINKIEKEILEEK